MNIATRVAGIVALGLVAGCTCGGDAGSPAVRAGVAPAEVEAPAAEGAAAEAAEVLALPAHVAAIEVAALARLLAQGGGAVRVFDANGDKTRRELGAIPGATLLADYKDCAAELPAAKDAKLVFYCYNELCGASHRAAEQAVHAGYADVNVLGAGIVGWRQAGHTVTQMLSH
jgi:rhodanese-related sulfurtransferase